MKFGYAIVLALVALVAVSGFASADRLPQEVPENQIFTIDTLIDVTGAVSQESEMQWTIISGDKTFNGYAYDGSGDMYNTINETQYNQLKAWAQDWAAKYGGAYSDYIKLLNQGTDKWLGNLYYIYVPDGDLDKMIGDQFSGQTFRNLIDLINDNANYVAATNTIYASIHDSALQPGEEIAILTWTDALRSNGGKLSLNENIDFDSRNKGKGLNNLEVEKVLTYASTEGAHLVGAEEWILDVAGNYEKAADSIRCVFASAKSEYFPAFCNVVKAKSELVNINSAQVSTKGAARGVASSGDVPAMLNYQIAVTPDSNSGSGFADGTVKTLFGGSIMEARENYEKPSATNNWKDTASVTGGIKNFQKTFNYESGFKF